MSPASTPRSLFLAFAGVLLGCGVLMVYSASMTSRPSDAEQVFLSRHVASLLAALACGWLASRLSPESWRRFAPWIFWGTMLLLVYVLAPGLGAKVNGARRWIRLAGFSLQPSEMMKFAAPVYAASLLQRRRDDGFWNDLRVIVAPLAGAAVLTAMEPDLGAAVLMLTAGGLAVWAMGWPGRRIAGALVLGSPSLLGLLFLRPYQRARLTGFVDAWTTPDGAPYQVKQSLLTLGAGGLAGAGLGAGWQKLSYLPEANTDFVFAVLGEELGLVGALVVVAAWIGLYLSGLRLLLTLEAGSFEYAVAFSWLTMLVLQAAVNVCVVAALLPPKGVAHPFLSYGGSSLLTSAMMLGGVLGLSRGDVPRSAPAKD